MRARLFGGSRSADEREAEVEREGGDGQDDEEAASRVRALVH